MGGQNRGWFEWNSNINKILPSDWVLSASPEYVMPQMGALLFCQHCWGRIVSVWMLLNLLNIVASRSLGGKQLRSILSARSDLPCTEYRKYYTRKNCKEWHSQTRGKFASYYKSICSPQSTDNKYLAEASPRWRSINWINAFTCVRKSLSLSHYRNTCRSVPSAFYILSIALWTEDKHL